MNQGFSFGNFVWFLGVIEDVKDPKKLGRVKVRCFGYHTDDKKEIPTDDLPYAWIMLPTTSAGISGIGETISWLVQGSHVIGFFTDGENAQCPVIMGAIGGIPKEKVPDKGFFDPDGKYPVYPLEEPDTNRLVRNEKIEETIVKTKKENLYTAKTVNDGTWKEPETPFNPEYPKNHVRESESGHIAEVDDTEGSERLHTYHKSGSFEEIHPKGDKVVKVVKDNYSIVLGNDYIAVDGNCSITVKGTANLLVEGMANIEVNGGVNEVITGAYNLTVKGNYTVNVEGMHVDNCEGNRDINASRIDLN